MSESVLLPKTTTVSEALIQLMLVTHVFSKSRYVMQPETKLLPMGHAASGCHVDVNGLCSHLKPDLMSVIKVASEGFVCICGPIAASVHAHGQSCC